MKTIAKRLVDNQDLLVEIQKLLDEHDVQAGVILSAVGSLKQTKIRMPVIDGNVQYIHPENVEIDALHGTVSRHGVHLHISVSDIEGKVWGGHVKEGNTIRTTCEIVIGILEDIVLKRSPDDTTGYDELEVEQL